MGRNSKARKSKGLRQQHGFKKGYDDFAYESQESRQRALRAAQRERDREFERRRGAELRRMMCEEPDGVLEIVWNKEKKAYYWSWSHLRITPPRTLTICQHYVEPIFFSHPLLPIWWSWAKLQATWRWLRDNANTFRRLSDTNRFIVASLSLIIIRVAMYIIFKM